MDDAVRVFQSFATAALVTREHPVTHGFLCVKGCFGYEFMHGGSKRRRAGITEWSEGWDTLHHRSSIGPSEEAPMQIEDILAGRRPKCEHCRTRDAQVRLEGLINGRPEAHLYCEVCASEVMRGAMHSEARPMDAEDVLAASEQCARFLTSFADADWSAPIPDLAWSVARAVAHAAEGPLWYAFDLVAGGAELTTMALRVKPESAPTDLIATLVAASRIVAQVITASTPDARGFHPWGQSDPSGFAAMACDELLIHTDDAGRGLGHVFTPDSALCARVLARLFPEAPSDVAPWDGLRWANGRIALPGWPRRTAWRWTGAPRET
jgi:hypothetical protein